MEEQKKLIKVLELVWWIFTVIVVYLVIRPILDNFTEFEYIWLNIFYIVVLITYARHIFLLKYTYLAKAEKVKVFLIFFSIPLVFFLMWMITNFQTFLDNDGHDTIFNYLKAPMSDEDKKGMLEYIHTEMMFFGFGAAFAGLLLPFRMVLSIWRQRNRGTV